MLKQQLQETKESLAARSAEVDELKARVAELEKLQQQQQQLLSMKDSELAAAQRNLAEANRAGSAPAAAAAVAPATTQQAPAPAPERGTGSAWVWGGVVLVVIALVGWLWSRRRRPAPARAERRFDTAALAASIPGAVPEDADEVDDDFEAGPDVAARAAEAVDVDVDAAAVAYEDAPYEEASYEDASYEDQALPADDRHAQAATAPDWTRAPAAIGTVPTWHAGNATAVAPAPARTPAEQLERARAYLDLGDDESARELLREVLDGRDPAARETAARMLREL